MRVLLCVLIAALPLGAQDYYPRTPRAPRPFAWTSPYPKHNFSVGVGAGLPRADLRALLQDSVNLNVSYGYRFLRNFQADIGWETLFGAARIRDFQNTPFGPLRIRDFQTFLPMGGRALLPFADGRVLAYGGGGGAYMRYAERIQQPFGDSGYRLACPTCAIRDGWGYYALVGSSVFIDQGHHFRVGATGRVYRGSSSGDPLGPVPAGRTRDQWINVVGEFGFSF